MAKCVQHLKVYLGRVVRDVERKIAVNSALGAVFEDLLSKANRILAQEKDTPNKLYSLHAPEAACIAKGKAHKRYEFGRKVALAVTHKEGIVVAAQALAGNPYDGHTLQSTLEAAKRVSDQAAKRVYLDRGYKGHGVEGTEVVMSNQKGLSPELKAALKRRNAIEPHIGHMKNEGKLGRNFLKGVLGDQLNALLVAIGYNLRLILTHIRHFFCFYLSGLLHELRFSFPRSSFFSLSPPFFKKFK
jgi:IS5 family transposase